MTTKSIAQLWAKVRDAVAASSEGGSWKIWLDPAHPRDLSDDTLILDVPNGFTKDQIQEKYLQIMEESLSQNCGRPMKIQLDVVRQTNEEQNLFPEQPSAPAQPEPAAPAAAPVMPAPAQAAKPVQEFDSHLSPKYTFDNFIRGKSNEEAYNFSMGVANAPAKSYNPLFLYSDPGLGKTHLMNAIGNYIHDHHPEMKILYISSETFTNELIGAIQHNTNEAFRNKYRNIDVLLIDDIQFLRKKESTQEEFFHTFEALKQADKQIIISSDRPPKELDTLEERLTSRFMQGLIIEINHPDFETRSAILRSMAEKDHIDFPLEVIQLIATNVKTNIRELEGAYTKVSAYASLTKQPVTMELARKALKDLDLGNSVDKVITVEAIMELVASRYKIRVEDLKAKKRTRSIAYPRQIAMYLTRELTDLSLPRIGECFGGRDHTTVLHACDKIADDKKNDANLERQLAKLTDELKK